MSTVTLDELLHLADAIADVDPKEKFVENGGDRTMPIRQYQMIAARFQSRRAAYVDSLLAENPDRTEVVRKVSLELDRRERVSDPSLTPAVRYVRAHLLPYLQRQARLPPAVRRTIKGLDKAFVIFAGVVVFGIPAYALLAYFYRLLK